MDTVNEIRLKYFNGEISKETALIKLDTHRIFLEQLMKRIETTGKDFDHFYASKQV